MLSTKQEGGAIRVVMYVVKNYQTCWVISYGLSENNLSRGMSIAEQSNRTFAVVAQIAK